MVWSFRPRRSRRFELAQEVAPGTRTGLSGRAASMEAWKGSQGVFVVPTPITAGDTVRVDYCGLLARSGASSVYLHAGYGPPKQWLGVRNVEMKKVDGGTWSTAFKVDRNMTGCFNFCFKDGANNWDNNYGINWNYEIHSGR